ncbi:uncharacterized protein LOC115919906 [Strongylocentrotus purpuratus]|uniref:Uncharacterized protein n=1 Tax=Strongylocentrotus purpuratus TaxID=7668 RepID=A0A7M7STJ3_STRPU|nr:uncharacterized protein LOC115919906 [Strongylocentrotus purpuratus]
MIAIAWILSLLVGGAPLTERLSYFHYSSSTHHCSPSWMNCFFYIFNLTFIYGLAVPTMLISHVSIIYTLRVKEKKLRSYGLSKSGKAQASRSEDRIPTITGSATMGPGMSMEGKWC